MTPGPRDVVGGRPAGIGSAAGGCVILHADTLGERGPAAVVAAAEHVTAATVTFMAIHAKGIIAVALTDERCRALELRPMAAPVTNPRRDMAACMVTIEARHGVTTGISAADRVHTIRTAADPTVGADAIVQPGHVVPMRARRADSLEPPGLTEGAIELARLAGAQPAAVLCRVLNDAGDAADADDLLEYSRRHRLPVVALSELVRERRQQPDAVECVGLRRVPTDDGGVDLIELEERGGGRYLVLLKGSLARGSDLPVAIRSQPLTSTAVRVEPERDPVVQEDLRWLQGRARGAVIRPLGRDATRGDLVARALLSGGWLSRLGLAMPRQGAPPAALVG